ncbi:transcription factor BIM2 isoform X1 [Cajanus cajan]|uniref:Transcription factor BIM2 n=1 Tax=Cajanus cajan TaxID=3821 RepID=A0A151TRW5_CAJCA|nr:transcription factor BIM2 isoform X1 [Cajanus cajan]XP_020213670.1 transcription factor BIM2 isoform X1 [Cajanus cajan]KYP69770.1 Transcription factor BIM2 [Cajanus cajan]
MRTGKGNQEEDEYEEEDFGSSKKQGTSSASNTNKADGKAIDKASAIRSKHSVTEQRRRSKINERFQILRDLIPHSDQKRDTASFLLEVIEYVQYLQEKVQKYEGSYQGWGQEPSKLMPWRNSHWRVQSFAGQPTGIKNGLGPVSPFPGKFDESSVNLSPTMLSGTQTTIDADQSRDIVSKTAERQPDLASKGIPLPVAMPMHANMSVPVRSDGVLAHPLQGTVSDAQSTECPTTSEPQNQQDELTVEGGTISISSAYSQGLLNNLTQALQSAGLDLSQASISVQINLGKRANKGLNCGTSSPKNHDNPSSNNQTLAHFRDTGSGEDSDQAQKRMKTYK